MRFLVISNKCEHLKNCAHTHPFSTPHNIFIHLPTNYINLTNWPIVRACRNAIEFNSIPSINRLVPGGYDKLKLDIILAIPPKYQEGLDLEAVANVFPYGETKFTIQDGGMVAPSGIAIDSLGDKNDDMVVVCCSVTVGYWIYIYTCTVYCTNYEVHVTSMIPKDIDVVYTVVRWHKNGNIG